MSEREQELMKMSVAELLDILENSPDENYVGCAWDELHQRDLVGMIN